MNLRTFYIVAGAAIVIQLALAAWAFAQVGIDAIVVLVALLALLALILVVGFAYSYQVWKADPDKRVQGGAA